MVWVWIALAAVVGGAAAAWGCRRHYADTIERLQRKLERVERARQAAEQRIVRAKAQIIGLNQTLHELQRQLRPPGLASGLPLHAASLDGAAAPPGPVTTFADTQPL